MTYGRLRAASAVLFLAFLLYLPQLAKAQAPPNPPSASVIASTFTVSATAASARTALPSTNPGPWPILTIANTGSADAYVATGDDTVTATTASIRVIAGTSISLWTNGTNVAYITASGSTALTIYQANGAVAVALNTPGSGGGGGGGAVNVTQIAGAATDTGTGAAGSGTIRVAPATDSLIGIKGANGTAIAAAANPVPTDARQIGGVALSTGAGASGTGTQRVVTATDSTIGTVTAVTTITNPVAANVSLAGSASATGAGASGATTQRVITATDSTIGTVTNAVGIKGVDGSAIASNSNAVPSQSVASIPNTAAMQTAATASGNGTGLTTNGMASAVLTVNCATCSGGTTVNFEGTEDGTNYVALTGVQVGTQSTGTTTTTAGVTVWQFPVAGFQTLRARISAYSAGTITVTGRSVPVDYAPKTLNANLYLGGSAVATGNGVVGATVPRVAIASDNSPISTNVTLAGSASATGNGNAGATVQRVTIAADNSAIAGAGVGAAGSAPPANAAYIAANAGGNLTGIIGCSASVVYDASTNGSTELVALTGGQSVYVCGYSFAAAGTVNVELDYGTGTACATGNTKILPAWQLNTTSLPGISDGAPFYRGLKTIASNALCIKTSAGVAVQGIVYYTKF